MAPFASYGTLVAKGDAVVERRATIASARHVHYVSQSTKEVTRVTEHRDESLMDKIKGALGMGDDARDEPEEMHAHTAGASVVTDADYDESTNLGGTGNRPAGPDFAAEETVPGEFGAGLDAEEMAGTGESNTGTGLAYDYEKGSVTEPVDESEWTRGGAASGETALDHDDDEVDSRRPELGI